MLTQTFHFFQTILDLHSTPPNVTASSSSSLLWSEEFRNFAIDQKGKTLETVQWMAPWFCDYACRPFQLLYDHADLDIVFDCTAYTYYLRFRKLAMIDIDIPKRTTKQLNEDDARKEMLLDFSSKYLEWLVSECEIHPDWRFAIYLSHNGLHIFPLHREFENPDECAEFQLQMNCDFYYILFCYVRKGCAIRLSAKKGEELPVYRFVGFLGHGETNPKLLKLVQFHEHLANFFSANPRDQGTTTGCLETE